MPAPAPQRVAAAVRRLRERRGLSQADLARLLDWPRGNVSRLEGGTEGPDGRVWRDVSVSTLDALAKALGCDPGMLVRAKTSQK